MVTNGLMSMIHKRGRLQTAERRKVEWRLLMTRRTYCIMYQRHWTKAITKRFANQQIQTDNKKDRAIKRSCFLFYTFMLAVRAAIIPWNNTISSTSAVWHNSAHQTWMHTCRLTEQKAATHVCQHNLHIDFIPAILCLLCILIAVAADNRDHPCRNTAFRM